MCRHTEEGGHGDAGDAVQDGERAALATGQAGSAAAHVRILEHQSALLSFQLLLVIELFHDVGAEEVVLDELC